MALKLEKDSMRGKAMINNVIIGEILCEPHHLFSFDEAEWNEVDKAETLVTEERYLPKILELVIGVKAKEIRRNRPDLDISLNDIGFFMVSYGKNKNKRHVWIAIGK